jgi:hypothetical protein
MGRLLRRLWGAYSLLKAGTCITTGHEYHCTLSTQRPTHSYAPYEAPSLPSRTAPMRRLWGAY